MLREDNIPVKNYFNFWFNREKKKRVLYNFYFFV